MQDRVGEDFNAIILSCTKYGFFVELDDLFIEGLVPLSSLQDDRYMFRDTDRQIVGTQSGRVFKMGQRVHVLLDRIDRQQRRLQFALASVGGGFGECSAVAAEVWIEDRRRVRCERRAAAFESEPVGEEGEDEVQGAGAE